MKNYVVVNAPHNVLRSLAHAAGVDMYELPLVLTAYTTAEEAIEVVMSRITDSPKTAGAREGAKVEREDGRVVAVRLADEMHEAVGYRRGTIGWSEPTFVVSHRARLDVPNRIVDGALPGHMS